MLRVFLISIVLIFTSSCVEWFNPEIDSQERVIVVEGLLTNKPGKHLIKLSLSLDYNQQFRFIPLKKATVYVIDNNGIKTEFIEKESGFYYTSDDVSGEIGNSYILNIETDDGEVYISQSQLMEEPIIIDSLTAQYEFRDELSTNDEGNIVINEVEGVGVYSDVKSHNSMPPRVRLETILLAQFILSEYSDDPDLFFCRIKRNIDETINITEPQLGIDIGSTIYHNVGFVKKTFYVPTVDTLFFKSLNRRMIILRNYTLNQESYIYYKELKNQLDSEGTLFDPIVSQIKGNIKCVSNTDRIALGFFEVSSYNSETFLFSPEPLKPSNLSISHIQSLDHLPDYEENWESIPEYWIY